jgi:hypothetical protein
LSKRTLKAISLATLIALAAALVLIRPTWLAEPALAKPAYMDRYNRNPYAKARFTDRCTVCHIGRAGAERNDFGEAFEDAGYRITPKIREKFPQFFEREPRQEGFDASPH